MGFFELAATAKQLNPWLVTVADGLHDSEIATANRPDRLRDCPRTAPATFDPEATGFALLASGNAGVT